jgi:YHS domain-containing protein/copper chaperone CopZ
MKERAVDQFDPVCGDLVKDATHTLGHLGVQFVFCSAQCKERFQLHPGLFVGCPGEKAPKQAGEEVIKQRCMRLAFPLMARRAAEVENCLQNLLGVKMVCISEDHVDIAYDLLLISAEEIEEKIIECGEYLGHSIRDRLERVFVHVGEQSEISSLEVHYKKKAD